MFNIKGLSALPIGVMLLVGVLALPAYAITSTTTNDKGSHIYSGTGVPSSTLGSDGDLYINKTNGDYYLKQSGVWVKQGNLMGPPGPAGPPGSQILTSPGIPDNGIGANGDFYMATSTGNYYQKESGSWVQKGNLVGPQGPSGTNPITTHMVEGDTVNVEPSLENHSIATCDGDSIVTGGGFGINPNLKVVQSNQFGNSWYVKAFNEGNYSGKCNL